MASVSPRAEYEAGQAIGPYQLVRRVERESTEEIWLARRTNAAGVFEAYALLLPPPHAIGDPRLRSWLDPLVALSPWLLHPNLQRILEQGDHGGAAYLVLEWVEGVPLAELEPALAQLAASDPAAWHAAIGHLVEQIAMGLAHAHASMGADGYPHGIVHRQLSPSQVLVSASGDVKLRGFGIADRPHDETSGIHAHGMLRYVPAEQLGGRMRLPSLDTYALGAILHELLDGRRFRGEQEDAMVLYRAAMSRELPALSRSVAPEAEAIRVALLQPDVAHRPRDGAAVLAMLAGWPARAQGRQPCAALVRAAVEQARRPTAAPLAGPPSLSADPSLPPPSAQPPMHAAHPQSYPPPDSVQQPAYRPQPSPYPPQSPAYPPPGAPYPPPAASYPPPAASYPPPAASYPPPAASYPPPAASYPPPAASHAPQPPAAVAQPPRAPVPSFLGLPIPEDDDPGTVEIDPAMLAAMRDAGRTNAPTNAPTSGGDAVMLPPGGRRASAPAASRPPPGPEQPPPLSAPRAPMPAPHSGMPQPPAPIAQPRPASSGYPQSAPVAHSRPASSAHPQSAPVAHSRPASSAHPQSAPVAHSRPASSAHPQSSVAPHSSAPPSSRAPERSREPSRGREPVPAPLELHPAEPTTTTMLQLRSSRRTFVLALVFGTLAAVGIGVGVGYLIVGDDPLASKPTSTPPAKGARE